MYAKKDYLNKKIILCGSQASSLLGTQYELYQTTPEKIKNNPKFLNSRLVHLVLSPNKIEYILKGLSQVAEITPDLLGENFPRTWSQLLNIEDKILKILSDRGHIVYNALMQPEGTCALWTHETRKYLCLDNLKFIVIEQDHNSFSYLQKDEIILFCPKDEKELSSLMQAVQKNWKISLNSWSNKTSALSLQELKVGIATESALTLSNQDPLFFMVKTNQAKKAFLKDLAYLILSPAERRSLRGYHYTEKACIGFFSKFGICSDISIHSIAPHLTLRDGEALALSCKAAYKIG